MLSDQIAISVEDLSKDFVLPHEKVSSIKGLFTNITKGRNKNTETQHALKNISFQVKEGEFFGIVGRNGSGKSTLLKILAGIYQPTAGNAHVRGKLVPFIELGVGFNGELTGRENVYLNGAMLGFSKKEIDSLYEDIVSFAELERFMDQKLKNYSSGMQVRLAFSMATRAQADILLVDEVLAVGDVDFQRKCFEHFRKLKKQKKTVIFVSHDMSAIREYCDRVVLIDDSRIILEGDTERIATAYTRMFNKSESAESSNNNEKGKRWGNGTIRYTDIKLSKKTILDNTPNLTLELTALAHKDVIDPIFGFSIKDSSGHPILGTNSRLKKQHTGNIKKGQTITVKWLIPNVFSDGTHYIEPALVQQDNVTICDWWEDAESFEVKKEERTPYSVTPQIELTFK